MNHDNTVRNGNIGEPLRHVEAEPLEEPVQVPQTPQKVPEKVPA